MFLDSHFELPTSAFPISCAPIALGEDVVKDERDAAPSTNKVEVKASRIPQMPRFTKDMVM